MLLPRAALLLALIVPAVHAQENPLPSPFDVARLQPGEPAWAPLLRIRAAEADYAGDRMQQQLYAQARAAREAWAGAHGAALRWIDAPFPPRDTVGVLPEGVRAVPARDLIVERAAETQVVMVNERHHADADRLLTLDLLAPLYEQDYRYLALEALYHTDTALQQRGYATDQTGYYTDALVFAETIREAIRLGYTLVPYEIRDGQRGVEGDTLSPQQRRDYAQALNLYSATLAQDPDARVLVHAGYSHVLEEATDRWSPMAYYLAEMTGIDPLTVDQTRLSERSAPGYEHPAYRAAAEASLLASTPVVLIDGAGEPLRPADFAVDLQVFGPRTTYTAGRPDWMAMGGHREPIEVEVPACAAQACFVEVHTPGEAEAAVPLDRAEADHVATVRAFVPVGHPSVIRVYSEEGKLLIVQTTTREGSGE